ncbi:MAG: hypothetical protein E2576_14210 [Alcaligenaceae bacterium]|nr:hypothetical protein [Alcaligenaceae bacterium SAGV5]MPS55181.1 hypothetical protein [Alcaligenaceae bacterium SAGV3]MPT57872.1 hypothetical protein [Alcaligenaceae bacterium]
MRTSLTVGTSGAVTIAYDDGFLGERVTRTFVCDANGGYVREMDNDGRYPQVCEGLARLGNTLSCGSRAALPELIRREYRRMRRTEQAQQRRAW